MIIDFTYYKTQAKKLYFLIIILFTSVIISCNKQEYITEHTPSQKSEIGVLKPHQTIKLKNPVAIEIDSSVLTTQKLSRKPSDLKSVEKIQDPMFPKKLKTTKGSEIDFNKLVTFRIDEDSNPQPFKFSIPKSGHAVFNEDTIWAPKTTSIREPKLLDAGTMRSKPQARVNIKYLSKETGLPQSVSHGIYNDSNGYIWIGTSTVGLIKYDGDYFWNYNLDRDKNAAIDEIIGDIKDGLWIRTNSAEYNIIFFDGYSFTYIGKRQGIENVSSIHLSNDGVLWIGTKQNGVFKLEQDNLTGFEVTNYTTLNGLTSNDILGIESLDNGDIWIATQKGINIYQNNTFIQWINLPGLVHELRGISKDWNGNIMYYDYSRIVRIKNKRYEVIERLEEKSTKDIYKIFPLKDNTIVIATFGTGIELLSDNTYISLSKENGMNANFISDLVEDHSGNIWTSSFDGGIDVINTNSFQIWPNEYSITDGRIDDIVEDNAGNIWILHFKGILKYNGQEIEKFESENYSTGYYNGYEALLDSFGQIWIGEYDELYVIDHEKFYTLLDSTTGKVPQEIKGVATMYNDRNGAIWLGSGKGIAKLEKDKLTSYSEIESFKNRFVNGITEDINDNMWITTTRDLILFDGHSFFHYPIERYFDNSIICNPTTDQEGNIVIASNNGLYKLVMESGVKFPSKLLHYRGIKPFEQSQIGSILMEDDGRIWLGTNSNGVI
ncbi:two-component regulator propeller domain-containing protein [uncultured Winogradskyella sp.]|uniref:ligand-binding sensor domain-containing protein n=1 Tax=uncultured Winogradskyella sp. TaxID=395353 RepID=UPI0026336FEA|nr:two-component regulator propeller domain-containing protein [uncultured Winogradskyella sp.]